MGFWNTLCSIAHGFHFFPQNISTEVYLLIFIILYRIVVDLSNERIDKVGLDAPQQSEKSPGDFHNVPRRLKVAEREIDPVLDEVQHSK